MSSVTLRTVTRKSVIGVAYVLQVLVGNVCLIDLAQAMAPGGVPEAAAPMSREDIPQSRETLTCPWISAESQTADPAAPSPCDSGTCMTNPAPEVPCLLTAVHASEPQTLPTYMAQDPVPPVHPDSPRPAPKGGPPPLALAGVVLRC